MAGPAALMKGNRLFDRSLWANLAAEAWSRRPPRFADDAPLSWPLGRADRLRVEWPKSLAWEADARWVELVRRGFASHVRFETSSIEQPWRGIVVVRVRVDDAVSTVVIDYDDETTLNRDALSVAALYFKMQHARGGYGDERVVPGGYPPNAPELLTMLAALRRARDRRPARHDVSGRFSVDYAPTVRQRAITMLEHQRAFEFTGSMRPVRYSAFLREAARSKVCIDLPGRGPFCFRLVDYLALGSCVVAAPHDAAMHVPLVDGEHLVYTKPDLSDLIELSSRLVEDRSERDRLGRNAKEYFDRYLTPRQIGSYYVRRVLDTLG